MENLQSLVKALEAGGYNAAPSTLVQGSALQIEDLSPVMQNVTYGEEHLKLQKVLKVEACKSTLAQFDRQLSYGNFGGSAQLEGAVGMEETSDFIRAVVPMAFYSHTRRVTVVANMVATVDGMKAEERAASDAAKKLAGDVEFDIFRGKADFSNAGYFDGNPLAIPNAPNMLGIDPQVRASDFSTNTKDLMFNEYGSNLSVIVPGGDVLSQSMIEDAHVRSSMNLGSADRLFVDPLVLSAYNKLTYGAGLGVSNIQRIILAGSPQDASGADLRRQWTSGGPVQIESSRFLSGKTTWARTRPQAPVWSGTPVTTPGLANTGSINPGSAGAANYYYVVTACNEAGESGPSAAIVASIPNYGSCVVDTITIATAKWFNVYRASVNNASKARFIGRVAAGAGGVLSFTDLGEKLPGFVTGYLLETDTLGLKELAPYSRLKLAVSDLSTPEAHFRFLTLAAFQPRKNVLVDNLKGAAAFNVGAAA
jgi:hypothetical protein